MVDKKGLFSFIGLTFVVSWLIMGGLWLAGGLAAGVVAAIALIAIMWVPGLCVLAVTQLITHEPMAVTGIRRLGIRRYYLWAWLLPVLLTLASALLTWLLGAGRLDLSFPQIREALEQAAAQVPGATQAQLPPVQAIIGAQMAFALLLAPLINTFFALGEELGWRGYLLHKLLPLGQWPALVLSGAIWGIWHAPVVVMGHNYPGHPVLGPFLMVGFCLLAGIILGWLRLASGSVWAPALAHGTFNALGGISLLVLADMDLAIGGPVSSLIGWIGLAACVGWLVFTRRLPVK
ncbi:MAG: CPBP family intramembrane metalloprotease [Anaerolineae bacterium]|nr:CPBP family intramembrane metalloprotease [Anaerolineae bacterium]